jgi:hypothetical protein
MPKQTRPDSDKEMPNQASNQEPAEGSRETTEAGVEPGGRDARESVTHDRQSHIVNDDAAEGDPTLPTKI